MISLIYKWVVITSFLMVMGYIFIEGVLPKHCDYAMVQSVGVCNMFGECIVVTDDQQIVVATFPVAGKPAEIMCETDFSFFTPEFLK